QDALESAVNHASLEISVALGNVGISVASLATSVGFVEGLAATIFRDASLVRTVTGLGQSLVNSFTNTEQFFSGYDFPNACRQLVSLTSRTISELLDLKKAILSPEAFKTFFGFQDQVARYAGRLASVIGLVQDIDNACKTIISSLESVDDANIRFNASVN